jgi:hypothetical protein
MGVENRGLVAIGSSLVLGLHAVGPGTTSFRSIDFAPPPTDPCAVTLNLSGYPDTQCLPLDLERSGSELLYAGVGGDGDPTAILGRATTIGEQHEIEVNPSDGLDGFTAVKRFGTTVYAARATGTVDAQNLFTGEARLFAYPAEFVAGTSPSLEVVLPGVQLVWAIEVDDDGVYVSGQRTAVLPPEGFVMKCTHDLVCPPTPP